MSQTRVGKTRPRAAAQPRSVVVPVLGVLLAAGLVSYVGLSWIQTQDREPASPAPLTQPLAPGAGRSQPGGYPVPGQPAPDFAVETLEHGRFVLADQRGKPTVVFFTASWCLPCIPQMQALHRIQQEVGADRLSVLVLDVDPSEGLPGLRQLKTLTGASFPFALDVGNRVTLLYGVRALDTKMFVDGTGLLVDRVDGIAESEGKLRSRVGALLKGPPGG